MSGFSSRRRVSATRRFSPPDRLSTEASPGGQYLDLKMSSESYFIFVVRDDRKAQLLFQTSDMTWLSYNRWPQWHSFYDTKTSQWSASAPDNYDVGFDRPYAMFWAMVRWGRRPVSSSTSRSPS